MTQLTGTVTKLISKEIKIANKPFIKNEITIDVDGEAKVLLKFTKPETTFTVANGTKIQANAEPQEDKYGNLSYKVSGGAENFILLDQQRTEKKEVKTASGSAGSYVKAVSNNSFNGDGAKRGNALTNAVTILLHNKKTAVTMDDENNLLELARMVYRVSTKLEIPEVEKVEAKSLETKSNEESSLFD